MSKLQGKIDFTLFISVKNANPNGDPLNGNRPRTDIDGYGEISDVCKKNKKPYAGFGRTYICTIR